MREKEYLIPSIENIESLYDEIVPMLKKLKTKKDVLDFQEKYKVTMEINYDFAELYDEQAPIEVIRCETFGDLDHIYLYNDGSVMFDVWCDFLDYDFIDGATIEKLKKYYIKGIKWLWSRDLNDSDRMELISVLRARGTDYNYMIEVYGFDSEIVEQYEAEHYEMGYGDKERVKGTINTVDDLIKMLQNLPADYEVSVSGMSDCGLMIDYKERTVLLDDVNYIEELLEE